MNDNALYLEADEDITSAIDKLRKQRGASVQIVVPKRSALLQSLINLKLLKKAASDERKELVVVTTDRVATELAARVGIAVAPAVGAHASFVQPKPVAHPKNTVEDVVRDDEELAAPRPMPEGRLEAAPLFTHREVGGSQPRNPLETPASDETAEPPISADEPRAVSARLGQPAKKVKVPNFRRLQHVVIGLVVVVALVSGYFAAVYFLGKASVTLYASASKLDIDTNFTVDPSATTDVGKGVLAGQTIKIEKDITAPFTPTGQKDAGTKATGIVTITNNCYNPGTIASGVTFAYGDLKYVSTAAVAVPDATCTVSGGVVTGTPTTADVPVTAVQNGDTYNIAKGLAMTMSVVSASNGTSMTAKSGSQFSGGLTKTVTVVTQDDVDKAKTAALAADQSGSYKDLAAKVASGSLAIDGSQAQTAGTVKSSPDINAEGANATVTVHVVYTQLEITNDDLKALLSSLAVKQAGADSQIYDNGFSSAKVSAVQSSNDSGGAKSFHLTASVYSGAKLNVAALAKAVAGKRYSDAHDLLSQQPGVQKVDVNIQPPWIGSLPTRPSKITITIKVSGIGK